MLMLRKIRVTLATISFIAVTLLFLDFTGTIHSYFGFLAKIQFLPALLGLHVGIVLLMIILTLIFGRVYCSVICPLGIFQDIFSRAAAIRNKRRFRHSKEMRGLRFGVLALFILSIVLGLSAVVVLLAPYSAYGRIASNLFAPIWQYGNNILADFAERADSYAFYTKDIWIKGMGTFVVAIITFVVIAILAWRNGRTYCNTICPVGTILGYVAKFSILKPYLDKQTCNSCGLCERNCKSSCISSKDKEIDYSRCVACFDCLESCTKGGIKYGRRSKIAEQTAEPKPVDQNMRKAFISTSAIVASAAVAKAQEMKVDGGLSVLTNKKIPERSSHIVPPGAKSLKNFATKCTACQLCVSVCPNKVLRPAMGLDRFMQPELSYEKGYCRPECTKCSEICPAGAIEPITREIKSSTQVGRAVWIKSNCVIFSDGVSCGNCAKHCPTGAIIMVPSDPNDPESVAIPAVNTERCIGCGACENLCPATPYSAIYVEGNSRHIIL